MTERPARGVIDASVVIGLGRIDEDSLPLETAITAAAAQVDADWLLGVGGGRVIDVAKGAAHQTGRPYAALPTSPATCAATAATVVVYDADGRHLMVREDGPAVAACALDPGLLAGAPDRLLAAGIVDAWAKVHEVRLTSGRAGPGSSTTRAARALLDADPCVRQTLPGLSAAQLLTAIREVDGWLRGQARVEA